MLKKSVLAFLIILFGLSSALCCEALDGNFDWHNINTEPFDDVAFGKTTLKQIRHKYKFFKKETLADGQVVLSYKKPKAPYSEVRIGFKEHKLDWIEYIFQKKQPLDSFLRIYGLPDNINKAHSDYYNYYDYKFFNVSTDKAAKDFYSLTLFAKPQLNSEYKQIDAFLPDTSELNFSKHFIPGLYMENDFIEDYPEIYPQIKDSVSKNYIVKHNIVSKYKKAEFAFRNGLLNFLVLYPKNLRYQQIVENYGLSSKAYTKKDGKVVYEYDNFTIVTDDKNQVVVIGIYSAI